MWAYIKDNKIEEIIARPKDMVIDDVRHSRRIFTAWTWDELNAIGIYTVEDGTKGDEKFQINSSPTYTFSKTNKKRGMSTFDFDDTLSYTKSGVRVVMPNLDGKPKPKRKVIFLAGGAGSGKGNVIRKLGLEKQGFNVLIPDNYVRTLSGINYSFVPSIEGFKAFNEIIYEFFALIWYFISGKI